MIQEALLYSHSMVRNKSTFFSSISLVVALMAVFFIISYPIAKLLDCLLGSDHGTLYRRAGLYVRTCLHLSVKYVFVYEVYIHICTYVSY